MSRHAQGRVLAGAVGGVAGGTAMTVMTTQVGPRVLPHDVLLDTPAPQRMVQWAEREAGEPEALSGLSEMVAGLGAHPGYSAATGAAYGLTRHAVRLQRPVARLVRPVC
jgi:hypothetical protein